MTSKSTGLTLLEAHNLNRWAAKKPDQLLWILQILMWQNLNFKENKIIFLIVNRKELNRGSQNRQKDILQQKNFVAGSFM